MRHIRPVALISGAALLAAVMVTPPAVADRYTGSDPAGDMAVQEASPTYVIAPAQTHRRLDIRRVFVRHTADFVSIRAVVGALTRPRGDEYFGLRGFVIVNRQAQPSEADAWQWEVYFDKRHRRHGDFLWVTDAQHQEQYGCDRFNFKVGGFQATAHYNGNWVTVTIPRRCLAFFDTDVRPCWVRVSVSTLHGLGPDEPTYFDHHRSQVPNPSPSRWDSHFFTLRLYPG